MKPVEISIIYGIAMLSCLCLTPFAGSCSAESPSRSVAAILPLTGNAADQGEWCKRGLDMAAEEVNARNPGALQIAYEDSRGGDAGVATQAYRGISVRLNPEAVFTFGSSVGMALSPLVNAGHVIQMGIATGTPKYTSLKDFTFRTFPSSALEAQFLSRALRNTLKVSRIAVININNDYGIGVANAIKSIFEKDGGAIGFEESYNPSDTDYRAQLLKIRQSNINVVLLASYPADGALFLKQAHELGVKKTFLASAAIVGGKDFFSVAGSAANGLIVASSIMDEAGDFATRYRARYPHESATQAIYAARAYDGLMTWFDAASRCKPSETGCVRDNLLGMKHWHGASGIISFDENGDVVTDFGLFEVQNARFYPWPRT